MRYLVPDGLDFYDCLTVAAIIQAGDPRHVVGQPYDVGTSARDGVRCLSPNSLSVFGVHGDHGLRRLFQQIIPRFLPSQNCDAYASRIQSYCDFDDFFCDSGTSLDVHESYAKYVGDARTFINDMLQC